MKNGAEQSVEGRATERNASIITATVLFAIFGVIAGLLLLLPLALGWKTLS